MGYQGGDDGACFAIWFAHYTCSAGISTRHIGTRVFPGWNEGLKTVRDAKVLWAATETPLRAVGIGAQSAVHRHILSSNVRIVSLLPTGCEMKKWDGDRV